MDRVLFYNQNDIGSIAETYDRFRNFHLNASLRSPAAAASADDVSAGPLLAEIDNGRRHQSWHSPLWLELIANEYQIPLPG